MAARDADYRLVTVEGQLHNKVMPAEGMADYRSALACVSTKPQAQGWHLGYQLNIFFPEYGSTLRLPRVSSNLRTASVCNTIAVVASRYTPVSSFFFPSEDKIDWEESGRIPGLFRASYPMQGAIQTQVPDAFDTAKVQIRVLIRDPLTGDYYIQPLQRKTKEIYRIDEWNCYFPIEKEWPVRETSTDLDRTSTMGRVSSSFPPPHMLLARREHEPQVSIDLTPPPVLAKLRVLKADLPKDGNSQAQGTQALAPADAACKLRSPVLPGRAGKSTRTYTPLKLAHTQG